MTITKSITIYCEGVIGGVLAAGTNGIVVNAAATDVVVLRGLDFDGAGTGLNAIRFLAGGALHVQDSLIRNFRGALPNGNGILFVPSTANAELYVTDTFVSNQGSGLGQSGIFIEPTGSGSARVVLNRVRVENNGSFGFRANSTGATTTIDATIVDSTFVGHGVNGVAATAAVGNGAIRLLIDSSTIANNATGIRGAGTTTTIRISNTNVTANGVGSNITNNGVFQSYGTNRIDGNDNNGSNAAIIPLK